MNYITVIVLLASAVTLISAWSLPYYPIRAPLKVKRLVAPPHHYAPIVVPAQEPDYDKEEWQRKKRNHHDDYSDDHSNHNNGGITGPVHTFVKTDKNANYKWGVRHHVGPKYV